MSEAKQRCQLVGCTRAASTRCFCCNKNVCTRHFTEHIDAVKAQIDPLANDINTMVEKIQGLTIEQITEASFAELQQWRMDMHQLIDEIFSAKHKEIDDLIENNKNEFVEHKKQQSKTMVKIQDDVKQLAEDGDATFEQIQLLRNQLAAVEISLTTFRKDFLSINAKVFAQGLVTVSSHLNKPSFIQNQQINQRRQRKLSEFFSSIIFLNKTDFDF
jgi:polyhydroxyalkanoate synthesis regulator phasin